MRNKLPTRDNLFQHGVISHDAQHCVSGRGKVETTNDLFFHCSIFFLCGVCFVIDWGFLLLTPSGSQIVLFSLLTLQVVRKYNTLLCTYFGSRMFELFGRK